MPLKMAVWKISDDMPVPLHAGKLNLESRLEDWIAADPSILGLNLLVIGRQVPTDFGGRIDLLTLDDEGNVAIVELKRDRTPREVVAQVLDYASWVKELTPERIHEVASGYLHKGLDVAFLERFDLSLPETLNVSHSMIVVASELDEPSERIIQYLVNEYGVSINAIFFNFFSGDGHELLGRSWLVDPKAVNEKKERRKQLPWSGLWYVNVDENWDDCVRYGFLSAGGGRVYSEALKRLSEGDRIFAYQKQSGYVGYGVVRRSRVMARDFVVSGSGEKLLSLSLQKNIGHDADDPDVCEWVVDVHWLKYFTLDQARKFPGVFANQNVVCKLRDPKTVEFLRREFEVSEDTETLGA